MYDYDAAGNPLSDGRYNYTYDSQGRLTEVKQAATTLVRNTYNTLGQRVRKDGARSTHYLYSTDGQLLVELDATGNTLREYLYLQSWPVAVVDYTAAPVAAAAVAVAEPVDSVEETTADAAPKDAETRADAPEASTPGTTLTYLHPDHLGTPRLATDSTKRVVWRWDSAPFGDTLPAADPDGDGVPFTLNLRFPGQYFDTETGLHYNYYRDYDPVTGRYLESDPIGLRGGVGTYGYVGGRPLTKRDLLGLIGYDSGSRCDKEQLQEIALASSKVWQKLSSACGRCGESGNCVPCEYADALKRAFQRVMVDCRENPSVGRTPCGATSEAGDRMAFYPRAFTHQMPSECGCLESIIYHELFHMPEVGISDSGHFIIEGFVLRCFDCARWHDPDGYPDYGY